MTVPTSSSTTSRFPTRTIARPVANLGNTCYMNAVLQALGACPELCMALDCMPHRTSCSIYHENVAKSRASSPSASSNESASAAGSAEENNDPPRKTATRKSLRSSGRRTPPGDGKKSDWTFCALCELEEHLHKVHDEALRDQPVAPSSFVNGFMEHVAPWFELGQQEDSHEFLRLLIDAMQKSCEKARPAIKEIVTATEDEDDDSPTASRTRSARNNKAKQAAEDSKDTEYPFSLFRGTVESTVTCESCQATSSTLDPIEDIGLEVLVQQGASGTATSRPALESVRSSSRNASPTPAAYPLADVTTAFQRFTRPEALDAGYKCEKCGKVGRANKQSRLASIPPILTLHLKRFRYGDAPAAPVSRRSGREVGQLLSSQSNSDLLYGGGSGSAKIEGHIKFDQLFDLRPYMTEELQEQHKNMFCRLFAVVVHAGKNSHSGHYVAYVRNLGKKEEWWKMDDGRVTPVSLQQVKQAEAYMLFYRVVQHPVATKLEQDYKAKVEEEQSKIELTVHKENDKTDSTLSSSDKTDNQGAFVTPRKRRANCAFANGEEWVRNKTRQPPHIIEIVRKTQEKIADDIIMTTESITKLSERVAKNETSPSLKSGHTISEDDIVGGTDVIRLKILDVIFNFNKENGQDKAWLGPPPNPAAVLTSTTTTTTAATTTTTTTTTPSTPTSREKPSLDDQRVAVVEPDDALDLL